MKKELRGKISLSSIVLNKNSSYIFYTNSFPSFLTPFPAPSLLPKFYHLVEPIYYKINIAKFFPSM